jgi:HlyD family secretion protein
VSTAAVTQIRPSHRRRRIWLLAALGVALVAAATTFWLRRPKPTEVQMATVTRDDLQAKVTANGKVQAQRKVDISATVPGQITLIAVGEGDRVRKGQFLLQIDSANPSATARSSESSMQALLRELESAQASREQAKADLRRAEENRRGGIISERDLENARTAHATAEATVQAAEHRVRQSRATLEGAQDTLHKTTVRAPMDGTVTAKRVEEGEVAVIGVLNQPGTVLLTISDMSVVEAELEVDETSVPSVKVGQEALVRIDAYPNKTFNGLVTDVGSSPILKTGSPNEAIKFKTKVQIKDPPADVKPGLSVQADILTGFREQALVMPIQALVVREVERGNSASRGVSRDEEGVFLAEDGKARFRAIQTGLMGELTVEVVSGLAGGETIVTGPFKALRTLKPGDAVKREEKKKDEDEPQG